MELGRNRKTGVQIQMRQIDDLAVDFDPGFEKNGIAVILQNPGRDERDAKPNPHPAAGDTGAHLEKVLSTIRKRLGRGALFDCDATHFCYDRHLPRHGVMVANAFPDVYFGKQKPPRELSCDHVQFVSRAICKKKIVLCFGAFACRCYERIVMAHCCAPMLEDQVVVECCHLSSCALQPLIGFNMRGLVVGGNIEERMNQRIDVVASYVWERLNERLDGTVSFTKFLSQIRCSKCECMR